MSSREAHEYATWTAEWRGGFAADVSARGHALRTDEPAEFGGGDSGPMPTELLTASIASCFCLAVAFAAGRAKVELADLEVGVRPMRAPGEPRYGRYVITISSSLPREKLVVLVDRAKQYCWVSNTLAAPPELEYHVESLA